MRSFGSCGATAKGAPTRLSQPKFNASLVLALLLFALQPVAAADLVIAGETKRLLTSFTTTSLRSAMSDWCSDSASANSYHGDIGSWDVSEVDDMDSLTMYCFTTSTFNEDLSAWDVGSVTTMDGMFYAASVFNADLSAWEVGSVTSMVWMFASASAFNQPLSTWDVTSVTDFRHMFDGSGMGQTLCWDLTGYDLTYSGYYNYNPDGWTIAYTQDLSDPACKCPVDTYGLAAPSTGCTACPEGTTSVAGSTSLVACEAAGFCFSSGSTVTALKPGAGTEPVALKDLAKGRRVLAATVAGERVVASVAAVHHSPAKEEYVVIAMHNKWGNQPKFSLEATPHHTFKTCGKFRTATTEAGNLKVGDCLQTVDGEAAIESIKRVAPAAGAETYTVVLEGGSGAEMLAVGGVFTHTKAAFTTAAAAALLKGRPQAVGALKEHLKTAFTTAKPAKAARGHVH